VVKPPHHWLDASELHFRWQALMTQNKFVPLQETTYPAEVLAWHLCVPLFSHLSHEISQIRSPPFLLMMATLPSGDASQQCVHVCPSQLHNGLSAFRHAGPALFLVTKGFQSQPEHHLSTRQIANRFRLAPCVPCVVALSLQLILETNDHRWSPVRAVASRSPGLGCRIERIGEGCVANLQMALNRH
jgi:hypothetical protein